jgi:predicted phage terminase large subunit-like protein
MLSVRQRLQLYCAILQEQRARQSLRDRIQHLRLNPYDLTEDDLDRWQDIDRRLLRGLFVDRPWIREQFVEYMDTPQLQTPSLFQFSRRAFPHAGFGNKPFKWNWHHIVMALAYQDFYTGKISRLMINVPPSTNKSTTSGVMFQAWAWAQDPIASFMYTSYSNEMPIKFTGHLKTLIQSPWYQRRWGKHFSLIKEAQRELRNTRGGWHFATSIHGAGQGIHPRYIFIDDPQKGMHTSSERKMAEAPKYFSNTLASRGLMDAARIAIIMQRLAINDLCGVILGETGGEDLDFIDDPELNAANDEMKVALQTIENDWHHICLPMRFDPDHPYRYPLDPRTEKNELLWPEELPLLAVLRLIREMGMSGEPNVEAQLDQNPKLTNKKLFGNVQIGRIAVSELPHLLRQGKAVRAWDRAATRGAGDWTVGVLMVLYAGTYYILDVQRKQLGPTERDNFIVQVAKSDRQKFDRYRVGSEMSIGPDAVGAHTDLAKRLDAVGVDAVPLKTGGKDKIVRATPLATAYENGLVRHLEGKNWTHRFEQELSLFPDGAHDDQVDAAAHGHKMLRDWEEMAP